MMAVENDQEGQEQSFPYWFNLFQATEDEAKRGGVGSAILYACGVTGWHSSEPTWRTLKGGLHVCTFKLYDSAEQILDCVRGSGGLRSEAEYAAQVAVLDAMLQLITGSTEAEALQDRVLAPEVVQRMVGALDLRRTALASAARASPGDVGGAYDAELVREQRVRGLSPREISAGESVQAG
jgi:hypothetical protein